VIMFLAQELQDARYHHARHYLHQLQIAASLYQQGGQQIQRSLTKFDQDWPQIAQGQSWAAHSGAERQAARLCCDFMRVGADLLNLRQSVAERRRWFDSVVAAARSLRWRDAECDALIHLGRALWLSGEVDQASDCLLQALELAEAGQTPARIARAHRYLGDIQAEQSAYAEARQHSSISLRIYEAIGDQHGIADVLCSLGNLALMVNDFPEASRFLDASLSAYRALDDRVGEANVLFCLGRLAGRQRDFVRAERCFSDSHAVYADLKHLEGLGQTCNMLGTTAMAVGDFARARTWFEQSLKAHSSLGSQDGIASAYMKLGEVEQYTGEFDRSEQHYRAALEIFQRMRNLYHAAGVAHRLGMLALTTGDDADAETWLTQTVAWCRAVGRSLGASALGGLGQIAVKHKQYEQAATLFADGLAEAQGDAWIIANLHQEWGNMDLLLNQRDSARDHFAQALEIARAIEAVPLVLSTLGSAARLLIDVQPEQALETAWFIYAHPAASQGDKNDVWPLIEMLQAKLAPQVAAHSRAQAQSATIESLIRHFA